MHHISGTVRESVDIEAPTVIDGIVQASVAIRGRVEVTLRGTIQGSTSVGPGSRLIIAGAQEGTVAIDAGAEVIVEEGGKLAGSLRNDGRVILRGVFGGSCTGAGILEIEGPGWIKPPDEVRDGAQVYHW